MIDTKITKAVQYAVGIANDNYHGYSQSRRGDRDKDCSLLVLDALESAGINVGAATYTGNMLKPLLDAGFVDVAKTINLITGAGIQYGDILLRPATSRRGGHTAFSIGDGHIIQAAGDLDGKPGDSSGKEIRTDFDYYNSPFLYVLRFPEEIAPAVSTEIKIGSIVQINGPGYATSYAEGSVRIVKATGKVIKIYKDNRKCPFAVNYTNLKEMWVDRFFSRSSLSL